MQGIDNLNTKREEWLHDYTNGYYPEWIEDHEFQPVYAKLGKMITDRIPYKLGLKPITKYEPEYWMLAGLLTQEEAKLCLDVIEDSGVELTLPIVYDPEIVVEDYYARINYISGEQFTDNAVAFCETIKKAGYTPAIYANSSTETDILDMSRLKGTTIWYADYSGIPETPYDFTFWQYSDLGWVDGIPETETDLNVWFIKK